MQRDPEYWAEKKGKVGEIVWMSPEEYIERCERGFKSIGEPGAVRGGRDPEKIKRYAADMKKGDKFPMLELDYSNGFGQEGLHRAMAAEVLGVEKVPVWVIKESPQAKAKKENEWKNKFAELKKQADEWDKQRQSDVVDDILGAFDEDLNETLKKVNGKWALVSKSNPKKVLQYYDGPKGQKPSKEWVRKVERRVHSFETKDNTKT
jgi:hypothetical protein